jgi:hypothetical protein
LCRDGPAGRGIEPRRPAGRSQAGTHRYLIERTFPAGALDGVDAAAKQKVNSNNKSLDVTWQKSYANADKTKTYCVYTGPSEKAVRDARRSTACRWTW